MVDDTGDDRHIRPDRTASVARGRGVTSPLRLDFWTAFKESMAGASAGAPELKLGRATSEGWIHTDCALNGGTLIAVARVRDREIGVQFAMDDLTAATIFALLKAHRGAVEQRHAEIARRSVGLLVGDHATGVATPLLWKPLGPRSFALEVRRSAEIRDREAWPDHFTWLRRQLLAVREALAPVLGREPSPGEKRQWDEASFFAELGRQNPAALSPARAILDWSRDHMPAVYWGHGRQFGSFVPGIARHGRTSTVVSVWTSGVVALRFAALKRLAPFDRESLRLQLLARFNRVPLFDLPPEAASRFPVIPLTTIADDESLNAFLEALEWFAATLARAEIAGAHGRSYADPRNTTTRALP